MLLHAEAAEVDVLLLVLVHLLPEPVQRRVVSLDLHRVHLAVLDEHLWGEGVGRTRGWGQPACPPNISWGKKGARHVSANLAKANPGPRYQKANNKRKSLKKIQTNFWLVQCSFVKPSAYDDVPITFIDAMLWVANNTLNGTFKTGCLTFPAGDISLHWAS